MRKEGLSQNDKNQLDDNFIKHKLEEAFGYSDEQLVKEFDEAAAQAAQQPNPKLIPPEDEFQKIMERVELEKRQERKNWARLRLPVGLQWILPRTTPVKYIATRICLTLATRLVISPKKRLVSNL